MSLTLGEVITSIRLKHPAFGSDTVPNRVLGEALGSAQRSLAMLGYQRRPTFLSQTFAVAFALNSANQTGQAGAGTDGGLPSLPDSSGVLGLAEQNAGIAPVYDLSDVTVLAAPRVITVVTDNGNDTTTLTFQGSPGWTVDEFLGELLWIVDGPGCGTFSLREILSNTADTITVDGTYDQLPAANESVAQVIVTPDQSSTELGVVTGLPAVTTTSGYLVKLDAQGNAYLDLASPVVAQVEAGIPLPQMVKILGITCVWVGDASNTDVLTPAVTSFRTKCALLPYAMRHSPAPFPSCYQLGNSLYLRGYTADWSGVQSLDIRYAPVPPMFSTGANALSEYFLLPDFASSVLEAAGAVTAAYYAEAKGARVNVKSFEDQQAAETQLFLRQVGQIGGAERFVSRVNR